MIFVQLCLSESTTSYIHNYYIQFTMGGGSAKGTTNNVVQYNKNMFNFSKVVGKGGFGKVWKVTDKKTKIVYALKVIDKAKVITKKSVSSIMNQKQLLCRLNHSFIVNMICSFQDRDNLYLLIDFLEGGDLRYYINRNYNFDERQTKFVIRCIMQGLRYLHEQNILHRDIKPENIIWDKKGYCRLTDLGIARYWKMENSSQTSGTPGYMAPEVLLRQNHSFCADYFAVGIIAYELIVGKRPFNGRNRKQIRDDMLAREVKFPTNTVNISKQGADFINKMIQRVSRKRLGFNGISEILDHPWLAMKAQQRTQFVNQTAKSPIKTLQITYHSSLQEVTEPDQVWKENILLLKKPQIQELFSNYNWQPDISKDLYPHKNEQSINFDKAQPSFNRFNLMPDATIRAFKNQ